MNITINEAGVAHLKESLATLHKRYAKLDEPAVNALLSRAEDNYRSGKGALVEIKVHESTTGRAEIIRFASNLYLNG